MTGVLGLVCAIGAGDPIVASPDSSYFPFGNDYSALKSADLYG